jgi:membrane protein YqaA with SNARE-associated domain
VRKPPDPSTLSDAQTAKRQRAAKKRAREHYRAGLEWLAQRMDQWWYLPCVSLFAGLDIFLLCFPTDVFLVTSSALRPRHWVRIFMAIALGSSLGMLAFAYAVKFGGPSIQPLLGWADPASAYSGHTALAVARYSALALFLIAVNPLVPPQPAIIVAVVAGMDPLTVFIWVYAGRLCKYSAYAFAAGRAPRLVGRWIRPVPERASATTVARDLPER